MELKLFVNCIGLVLGHRVSYIHKVVCEIGI